MISSPFKRHIQLPCTEQAEPGGKSSSGKPVGLLEQAARAEGGGLQGQGMAAELAGGSCFFIFYFSAQPVTHRNVNPIVKTLPFHCRVQGFD